jgi:hypothetical protein
MQFTKIGLPGKVKKTGARRAADKEWAMDGPGVYDERTRNVDGRTGTVRRTDQKN